MTKGLDVGRRRAMKPGARLPAPSLTSKQKAEAWDRAARLLGRSCWRWDAIDYHIADVIRPSLARRASIIRRNGRKS